MHQRRQRAQREPSTQHQAAALPPPRPCAPSVSGENGPLRYLLCSAGLSYASDCAISSTTSTSEHILHLGAKSNPTTVYDGVYHTPLGRFSMLDISTFGVVPVPRSALAISRRELSEGVSFGVRTQLFVEQSSFESRPRRV